MRITTVVAVFAGAVTAAALGAGASVAPSTASLAASTHLDQVTMDFGTHNGVQLQINASNTTSTSAGKATVSSIAVASLQDIEGSAGLGVADCYPAGNVVPVQTLPAGALVFGPSPKEASLRASFTCTRTSGGGRFPLTVDLRWSATTDFVHHGWRNSQWRAAISGTASDGTTDYNEPPKSGMIIHETYGTVGAPLVAPATSFTRAVG